MTSPHPPAGGPVGRPSGESLADPVVPPAEVNGTSRDGDGVDAPERTVDVETGSHKRAEQVRAQVAARAAQLRGQAVEKAPQVRAQAAANRGKAAAALGSVVLVLWLRRRRSRRASRTADGLAGALDQQARSLVGDTVDALSAEAGSTGRGRDKTRARAAAKAQARAQAIEKAQQARAQAIEKAQQARAQAIEKAQQLHAQAREKAQAAEKAQQAAQEAQELLRSLRKRLPRRVTRTG
jgi:colicin import membrane protein